MYYIYPGCVTSIQAEVLSLQKWKKEKLILCTLIICMYFFLNGSTIYTYRVGFKYWPCWIHCYNPSKQRVILSGFTSFLSFIFLIKKDMSPGLLNTNLNDEYYQCIKISESIGRMMFTLLKGVLWFISSNRSFDSPAIPQTCAPAPWPKQNCEGLIGGLPFISFPPTYRQNNRYILFVTNRLI